MKLFVLLLLLAIIVATCVSTTTMKSANTLYKISPTSGDMATMADPKDWIQANLFQQRNTDLTFGQGQRFGQVQFKFRPSDITTEQLEVRVKFFTRTESGDIDTVFYATPYETIPLQQVDFQEHFIEVILPTGSDAFTGKDLHCGLSWKFNQTEEVDIIWITAFRIVKYGWTNATTCTARKVCGSFSNSESAICSITEPSDLSHLVANFNNASDELKQLWCPSDTKPANVDVTCSTNDTCLNDGECTLDTTTKVNFCQCTPDFYGEVCQFDHATQSWIAELEVDLWTPPDNTFGQDQPMGTVTVTYYLARVTTEAFNFFFFLAKRKADGSMGEIVFRIQDTSPLDAAGVETRREVLFISLPVEHDLIVGKDLFAGIGWYINNEKTRWLTKVFTPEQHSPINVVKYGWVKATECSIDAICGNFERQEGAVCRITEPSDMTHLTGNYEAVSDFERSRFCPDATKPTDSTLIKCSSAQKCQNDGICTFDATDEFNYCQCEVGFKGDLCQDKSDRSSAMIISTSFVAVIAIISLLF